MADVFISYKREEREAVERLASALRDLDLRVWFDASLSAGEAFSDEIDREAREAKAVLVCWSAAARDSRWVKSEALIGFERDTLAAAYVAGPDGFSAPAPFNSVHAEDLRAWLSAPTPVHAGWRSLLRRIGALCGRKDIESWGALDAQARAEDLRAWIAKHPNSPLFLTVEEFLHARERQDSDRGALEQAARERREREASARAKREAREAAEERNRRDDDREVRVARVLEEIKASNAARKRDAQRATNIRYGAFAAGLAVIAAITFIATRPKEQSSEPEAIVTEVAPARAWRDFEEFDDCEQAGWCPRMIVLPAGSFLMGSSDSEVVGGADSETPQHRVTLRQFAVGKYEVTFNQWEACARQDQCSSNPYPNDNGWGRASKPVINVSRRDVQEYVQWLSARTGAQYRLLTEAEWEYAARGGTTTLWSWGNNASDGCQYANFNNEFVGVGVDSKFQAQCADGVTGKTAIVGQFKPNPFGLYDMHGNVDEWVEDCFIATYFDAPTDGSAAVRRPCEHTKRGGQYSGTVFTIRSAARSFTASVTDTRSYTIGFRVAREL